jgi:hypothetical protein
MLHEALQLGRLAVLLAAAVWNGAAVAVVDWGSPGLRHAAR